MPRGIHTGPGFKVHSSESEPRLPKQSRGKFKGRSVQGTDGQRRVARYSDNRIYPYNPDRNADIYDRDVKTKGTAKKIALGTAGTAVAGGIGGTLGVLFSAPDYKSTIQPDLGKNEAEEYAIFKQLMEP